MVNINGKSYTLITIVGETEESSGMLGKDKITAYAYVIDKKDSSKVLRFKASEIIKVD